MALENIDVPACRARGVEVVHTPEANTLAVVALAGVVVLSSRDTLAEESRSAVAPEAGRAVPGVAP